MTEYKTTTVAVTVHSPTDNALYGDTVTPVALQDEAGGFFLEVSQEGKDPLRFDLEELEAVVVAARDLIEKGEI